MTLIKHIGDGIICALVWLAVLAGSYFVHGYKRGRRH